MKLYSFGILLALLPFLAVAQTGGLSGPVLGYVPESGALRPILGIPGAAVLGQPLALGFETALLSVAPRQDYALAVAAQGEVKIIPLSGDFAARAVEAALAAPDRVIFSPTGTAALLVRSSDSAAQVLTGLPDSPRTVALGLASLPDKPGALAVSDDGGSVLTAAAGSVFVIAPGGTARPLPASGETTLMAFVPGSLDAFLAGPGQVAVLTGIMGESAFRLLPAIDGLDTPVALATVPGGRAYVAGSGMVARVDMDSGASAALPCSCVITGLAPLNGDALFRLNELSADPLWLMEAATAQPRMLFVPPAVPTPEVSQQ